jgi:SNF2 family DNA or RNA helicase
MLTNRRTLLADEMGLGKTVHALSLLATEQAWPADRGAAAPVRHWDKTHDLLDAGKNELPLFVHQPSNAGGIRAQSVAIPRSCG